MSIERVKPLILAGVAGIFSTVVFMSGAQAQEAPKKAAPAQAQAQKQEKPVAETKPSEQTQDVGDGITVPDYRDDRSTPQALMESYYNAINRKEYARAYSYYSEEGREPDFKTFAKGYEGTKSVKVAVRKTDPDPGAGQIYWSLPIAIRSEGDDGKKRSVYGLLYDPLNQSWHAGRTALQTDADHDRFVDQVAVGNRKSVPESCEAP